MANIESIDEAVEIIQDGSLENEVKDALAYLMANDPSHPYVVQYKQNPEAFMAGYAQTMVNAYEQSQDELSVLLDEDELRVQVDEEDLENVKNNEKSIEKAVADSDEFDTERRALENTTITGDDGQVLSEKEQNDAREAFYLAILENTKLVLAGDSSYTRASEKDRETRATQIFRDSFRASFAAMLESKVGPQQEGESNREYKKRVVETVAQADKPYEISRAFVAAQTSGVQNEITARAKYYYYKSRMAVGSAKSNLKKLSGYFKEKSTKFGALMNKLTHGAHEMAMQTWKWAKMNKGQVATMTAMSVGAMVGTMATGGAALVPAVYATAVSVTSWIFPLTNRRNQMIADIKDEKVQGNIDDWKGLKGIKKAYQTMSKKEKKKYYAMAGTMSVVGVAGAGLMGATSGAAALAQARLGTTVARVAGASAVQGGFLIDTDLEMKKAKKALLAAQAELAENPEDPKLNKNVEKLFKDLADLKKSRNAQRFGLGLTAGLGALSSWMMAGNAAAHAADANGVPADSLASDTTHTSGADVADVADAAPVAPEVSEAQAYYENYEVPTEYSEDLGITKNDWRFLKNVLTGEFATAEGAEHLGGEQVNSEAFFDQALRNVATYMHEHPEFAEGKTPLKALNDIVRRTAWSLIPEQSHADGHLFTIGDFKFAQYNDEMKDIWAIICNGYDADVTMSAEELNKAIEAVQSDGGLEGVVGTRNVRMVGLACQEAAFKRGPRVHIHVPHDHPVRVSTPTPLEKTETVVDVPQERVPLEKTETVVDVPQERVPLEKTETVVDVPQENIVSAQVNDATGISGQGSGQLPENTGNIYTQGNVAVELDERGNPAAFVGRMKQGHGR
ncbi:MAG: hypothetical protein IJ852_03460 [Alphaproteobacteria bacterium]|nr:hypothetical protein [Alphaproteobacteria bacterium]